LLKVASVFRDAIVPLEVTARVLHTARGIRIATLLGGVVVASKLSDEVDESLPVPALFKVAIALRGWWSIFLEAATTTVVSSVSALAAALSRLRSTLRGLSRKGEGNADAALDRLSLTARFLGTHRVREDGVLHGVRLDTQCLAEDTASLISTRSEGAVSFAFVVKHGNNADHGVFLDALVLVSVASTSAVPEVLPTSGVVAVAVRLVPVVIVTAALLEPPPSSALAFVVL